MIVIGAGVAGLACAAALRDGGREATVLEKSRGVGGRCATRRLDGVPVDHGLSFYHGNDPDFLAALLDVEPEPPFPWPRRVVGSGAPCQPEAFRGSQRRLAFARGVTAFPKHLARGLQVRLETTVTHISNEEGGLTVGLDGGTALRARAVVLAVPAAQAARLVTTLPCDDDAGIAAVSRLLDGIAMVRCLTVMAVYPDGITLPDWDVCYPESSDILQTVILDSSKRNAPARPAFVAQARPAWSARLWDAPVGEWSRSMQDALCSIIAGGPGGAAYIETHRWRYARLTGGDALTAPLLLELDGGARLGITGEAMSPGGGVQAAWQAGRRMALRLLGDSK